MVAIIPLHNVRWFPLIVVNLQNETMTIRLAHSMPSDEDSIANSCEHDASDPKPYDILSTALVELTPGTKVPRGDGPIGSHSKNQLVVALAQSSNLRQTTFPTTSR